MLAKCKMLPGIAERALAPVSPSIRGIGGRGRSHMERMLGRSDGMEQLDSVPCDNWVEFDSDPFANPHLNADPGTIIAFPGEISGLGPFGRQKYKEPRFIVIGAKFPSML